MEDNDGKLARFCYKHSKKTGAGTLKTKSRVCLHQGMFHLECFETIEEVDSAADAEINGGGDLTGHVQDNAGAATTTRSSSLPSRPVFGCDTSPLDEIDLLRKARQSAQAEAAAAASGNGKRPKTPSRKALEASGVAGVVQDAPQHMANEIREETAPETSRGMRDQRTRVKGDREWTWITGQVTGDAAGSSGFIGTFGGNDSTFRPKGDDAGSRPFIGGFGRNGFGRVGAICDDTWPSSEDVLSEYLRQRRQYYQQEEQQQEKEQQQRQQQCSASLTPHQWQSSTVTTGASASQRRPGDAAHSWSAGNVDTNKRRGGVAENNRKKKAKEKHTSAICGLQGEGEEGAIVTEPATLCAFEDCRAGATYGVNNIVRYCQNHRLFGMCKMS